MRKPPEILFTNSAAQLQTPAPFCRGWHVRVPGQGVLFGPPHVGEQKPVKGLHTEFAGQPAVHGIIAHDPAKQVVVGCVQTLLQMPQSRLLELGSTQAPLQAIWPAGHVHAPFVHEAPAAHILLQLPQCCVLLLRSTQLPLQLVSPAGHVGMHWLPEQVSRAGQTLPQLPQFIGSVAGFVQAPLQEISPAGHVCMHRPPEQTSPAGQTVPQAPQLLGSVFVLTQVLSQLVWPAGQLMPQQH